jgi:hypothetical protein
MYAVLFQVEMKPNWEGDRDTGLDQLTETVKAVPGFIRGTWASNDKLGCSFIVVENEEAAKAIVGNRTIPPDAPVTFRSADIYEIARDINPQVLSFPYLSDRPACRSVRAPRSTGHGFQFSADDGFA